MVCFSWFGGGGCFFWAGVSRWFCVCVFFWGGSIGVGLCKPTRGYKVSFLRLGVPNVGTLVRLQNICLEPSLALLELVDV